MLGSVKPHHCFPIDGASGKHFVEAAWSEEFIAMMVTTYQLRLSEKTKKQADEMEAKVPTQVTGQLAVSAVNEAAESSATATTLLEQPQNAAESSSATVAVDNSDAAEVSLACASAVPQLSDSIPNMQEQPRKRQFSDSDDTYDRLQKSVCATKPSHSGGRAAVTSTPTQASALADGMTLYDRVKEMHDLRVRAAQPNAPEARSSKVSLSRLSQKEEQLQEQDERAKQKPDHAVQQQQQQAQVKAEQLKNEQQRLNHLRHLNIQKQEERQRLKVAQQEQEKQRKEELRLKATQKELERQRWIVEQKKRQDQRPQANQWREDKRKQSELQQQQEHQLLEERIRHEQIMLQQDEARSLIREGDRFASHAQYMLHVQPSYTSIASSDISAPMPVAAIAPLSVSVMMPSDARFTQVQSPASGSPHASRFGSDVSSPQQNYPLPSNRVDSAASAFSPIGNGHVYQEHTAVPVSRFETISQNHDGNCHLVVRNSNPNTQQQPQLQSDYPDAMVLHRHVTEGDLSPSMSGEDDELRAIWVSDYDNVNALVMQLDMEITKRAEEGHSFVHMSNSITIPEQLKLQLNKLCAQRDTAIKKRFNSLARVLIFSNAVRSFAQQHEHSNIWNDVPEVLKASHKKCAELAVSIRVLERQAQKLREGINEAVSNGDPMQMQHVVHLSAHIADLERKIRTSNGERDKQFIFMFQFSSKLRNMVRAEWAATGGGGYQSKQ
ncbi:unnamed protein product [Peronospora belbahrii]|uniref:Uncharacterized protein n=1 Tax=Peronospora belbahrii TaxID=622444 RepID=A0ABN8CJR7_9STRA|nr:unnamed protein product [Peronospora belbahrii]